PARAVDPSRDADVATQRGSGNVAPPASSGQRLPSHARKELEVDEPRGRRLAVLDVQAALAVECDPGREVELPVAMARRAEPAEQRSVRREGEDPGRIPALRALRDEDPAIGIDRQIARLLVERAVTDHPEAFPGPVEDEDLRRA